jgi:hypothetical protein
MHDQNTVEYYQMREATERKIAAECHDRSIASIHLKMAERYAERADDISRGRRARLHIVTNDRHAHP